ncbi:RidA family protein [Nocardia sp. NPDC004068]|uniref:RidA family protein n=1 Tax=Nocardia sp. NPDC004068 TaxID=3364303 RepID=UPI0036A18898
MSGAPFPAARVGGGLVFTSGLAAIDPDTLTVSARSFGEQVEAVLGQLDKVLADAGASRADVLALDCFLAERRWFSEWNAAFAAFFTTAAPARTTTVVTLPIDGLLIEIKAIALAPHQEERS